MEGDRYGKLKLAIALGMVMVGVLGAWHSRPITRPPGVLAAGEPVQSAPTAAAFAVGAFQLTPLANYHIVARVLSTESYRFDAGAALAPVDLAVGWGPMSDSHVLGHFKVNQGARFFTIYPDADAIDLNLALEHAANMHLIPADSSIRRALKRIKPGHVVTMQGHLVEVVGKDGFTWRSSLTRTDTGNGACELMYVESLSYE